MNAFHFRRVTGIVLAWVPQQAGPETQGLLEGGAVGESGPWSRSEEQEEAALGLSKCHVNWVSELPAEGMKRKW